MTPYTYSKDDRRVQRTRKLIQEALIELSIQKGYAAVTVQDITDYAGINRATFYRHYMDKFDLLDQHAQEVFELLNASVEPETTIGRDNLPLEEATIGLRKILEHILAHKAFYRVMLGKNGDPAFAEKIQQYMVERIRNVLPVNLLREKQLDILYLSYVSSASLGVIRSWLEHDLRYSPNQLAAIFYRLVANDLNTVLGHTNS